MQWNEDAAFVNTNQWDIVPVDAEYDSNGVFQRGRLTDEVNGGIPFGADVRAATRESITNDFSGGYKKTTGNWELSTDLQYTESSSDFFFQAEDGIRDADVTGVQTCALPILVLANQFCGSRRGGSSDIGNEVSDAKIHFVTHSTDNR